MNPDDNDPTDTSVPPLPQDTGSPANDPDDIPASDGELNVEHPATDTNIQPEEQYDEGASGAAEAVEPNAGNAVEDYNPPE